jgi:hypothetical protein
MKVDLEFVGQLKKYGIFKIFDQIPNTDNIYEYAIAQFEDGDVTGTLYLEHEIIDSFDKVIGNFVVNFEHKIFVYNLKKEHLRDQIIRSVTNEKKH